MPVFPIAALCGLLGALAAHVTYVQSNLFLLGDVTRRGRHVLWDPAFFDGVGLLWGIVVGIVVARFFAASPGKALVVGLAVTVIGVGLVGGATTISRYSAQPRAPLIAGRKVELEFELRLPSTRTDGAVQPSHGVIRSDLRDETDAVLERGAMRMVEGRTVIPGHVALRRAESPRLLTFEDPGDVWINFMLPLAESPTSADEAWSDWMQAANADPALPVTETFEIRYRVRFGLAR